MYAPQRQRCLVKKKIRAEGPNACSSLLKIDRDIVDILKMPKMRDITLKPNLSTNRASRKSWHWSRVEDMLRQSLARAAQMTADRLPNACFWMSTSAVGAQIVIRLRYIKVADMLRQSLARAVQMTADRIPNACFWMSTSAVDVQIAIHLQFTNILDINDEGLSSVTLITFTKVETLNNGMVWDNNHCRVNHQVVLLHASALAKQAPAPASAPTQSSAHQRRCRSCPKSSRCSCSGVAAGSGLEGRSQRARNLTHSRDNSVMCSHATEEALWRMAAAMEVCERRGVEAWRHV
jgi:hypothetical protein